MAQNQSDNNYFKKYFEETSKVNGYSDSVVRGNKVYDYNYTNNDLIKIFQSFDPATKKKIRNKMVIIDLNNGDMQHYIDYIMKGYTNLQRGEKPK